MCIFTFALTSQRAEVFDVLFGGYFHVNKSSGSVNGYMNHLTCE